MSRQDQKVEDVQLADTDYCFHLSSYPIDMSSYLTLPHCAFDAVGIPYHRNSPVDHPNIIAHYALALWNQYLAPRDEYHSKAFLVQANWLVIHETRIGIDAGGWPITLSLPDVNTEGPWLSALTQGCAISVLVRAYQLTHERAFLEIASRAARTFHLDILDGGVSALVGKDGIFFEEVAVYPANHRLKGFIFGLFGLYDYVELTGDTQFETLISRSHTTLHNLLSEFDIGFWTRSDLLDRHLSSRAELALHISLLDALARHSSCDHCAALALRWKNYQQHLGSQLRYFVISRCNHFGHVLWSRIRTRLFRERSSRRIYGPIRQDFLSVCIPITAFPVTGGMRTVLSRIALVTKDIWQLEYLTQYVGSDTDGLIIHRFGTRKMASSQFPAVWLYTLAGFWKLVSLLRGGANYDLLVLQDGIYTAAFGGLVAKMAGIRSVCIDHGNLGLLKSRAYRSERIQAIAIENWSWSRRLLARLQYAFYWPSLSILARFGACFVDHYFIPGVAGDGVEAICKSLGVHSSRITRFANMIEIERHVIPNVTLKAETREKYGIAADSIVIAIICRLAPEKGLEIALEAISHAFSALSPDIAKRVRIIIAGDGPLRRQIEEKINLRGLNHACLLWGNASKEEVITILGVSDIFLFTSWRAAGYPLAVLEAMASGCAVVASTESLANEEMLNGGRGVVLPVGDVEGTGKALVRLMSDPELRQQMGSLARNYVAVEHSPNMFRRSLMRVTYWARLNELLVKDASVLRSESKN